MDLLRELAGQTFIRFIIENFYTKDVIRSTNKKLLMNCIKSYYNSGIDSNFYCISKVLYFDTDL